MYLCHLRIENFRGIRELDWHLNGRVLCLIGPNDSTKSTVLDAIELALLPRSNPQLSDADFHNANTDNPIVIEATLGELPEEALVESEKYGLLLRGYHPVEGLKDDPVDGAEPVVTVHFQMGRDFEAVWTVIKPITGEAKRIGWQERERLGLARLGEDMERHLTWSRGSALSKLTAKGGSTAQALTEAMRNAKQVVADSPLVELNEAAGKAKTAAELFGVPLHDLKAGLDAIAMSFGVSVLGLYEAAVPLRLAGLGTKRLIALAIQQSGVGQHSILLVDEIEHGLEPHRIRHLLNRLAYCDDGKERTEGQVIFTTHSPTSVIVLPVEKVRFVRSKAGKTVIAQVDKSHIGELQGFARTHPHAFLGRKLLVCEGATEVGLCRGLEEMWCAQRKGRHPTHIGLVALDGKGRTNAPPLALELKRLGYDVAVLADSDASLVPTAADLIAAGIPVFVWDGAVATEQRIALDLPLANLQVLVDAACAEYGEASVVDQVGHFGGVKLTNAGTQIATWISAQFNEEAVRAAVGLAAKKGRTGANTIGWFKDVAFGVCLGAVVADAWDAVAQKPLGVRLKELSDWIYA